jgi:hypothetical protein
MPAPKELTVVFTPVGTGWRYEATGTAADGQPLKRSFDFVKNGQEIPTTGFTFCDTIVIKDADLPKALSLFKRGGRTIGIGTRAFSEDGKTMIMTGTLTTPDEKNASYITVYERQ